MRNKKYLLVVLAIMFLFPFKVSASIESEIKENKEITIKSVPPKNMMEYYQIGESFNEETNLIMDECNSTFTVCNIFKVDGTLVASDVTIKYEYDADVKKVVDGIMKKIPENGKVFYVEDIYALKWIIDDAEYYLSLEEGIEDGINPIKYSPEYNSFVSYNNFVFEPRMGFESLFASFKGGTARFNYNDTTYGFADGIGVRVNHVLYVDDNEKDITGALKKRLSKYFDIDNITRDDEYTLADILDDELNYYRENYNTCVSNKANVEGLKGEYETLKGELDAIQADIDALDAIPINERSEEDNNNLAAKSVELSNKEYAVTVAKQNYENAQGDLASTCGILDEYDTADLYVAAMREELLDENNVDSEFSLFSKALPNIYVITLKNSDLAGLGFLVIKDSSKIVNDNLEVKTRDAKSGVTISNIGTNNVIPLDTLIEVSKLTSGEEYNKIVKTLETVLDKDNMEMFDLKLFSKSTSDYITKLDDGSFEVRIPISDKFKGKKLKIYYVDDNDRVKEYEVTVKEIDGISYGIYTTNHFSIYTLTATEEENVPQTFDSINSYIVMLIISLIITTISVKFLNKIYE